MQMLGAAGSTTEEACGDGLWPMVSFFSFFFSIILVLCFFLFHLSFCYRGLRCRWGAWDASMSQAPFYYCLNCSHYSIIVIKHVIFSCVVIGSGSVLAQPSADPGPGLAECGLTLRARVKGQGKWVGPGPTWPLDSVVTHASDAVSHEFVHKHMTGPCAALGVYKQPPSDDHRSPMAKFLLAHACACQFLHPHLQAQDSCVTGVGLHSNWYQYNLISIPSEELLQFTVLVIYII